MYLSSLQNIIRSFIIFYSIFKYNIVFDISVSLAYQKPPKQLFKESRSPYIQFNLILAII